MTQDAPHKSPGLHQDASLPAQGNEPPETVPEYLRDVDRCFWRAKTRLTPPGVPADTEGPAQAEREIDGLPDVDEIDLKQDRPLTVAG